MSFTFNKNQKEFVFLHIPKNGGKSLVEYFSKNGIRRPGKRFIGHLSYLETENLFEDKKERIFFAISRNPWERWVSFYHYLKVDHHSLIKLGILNKFFKWSFEEFIDWSIESNEKLLRPQWDYIINEKSEVSVEILKLENIDQDVKDFCKRRNLDPVKTHKSNTSNHGIYTGYYNNSTIDKIQKYESGIIKLVNYEYE
jgi:hypothetical protein